MCATELPLFIKLGGSRFWGSPPTGRCPTRWLAGVRRLALVARGEEKHGLMRERTETSKRVQAPVCVCVCVCVNMCVCVCVCVCRNCPLVAPRYTYLKAVHRVALTENDMR